ncbi:hypothetical protein CB1_000154006 [Camelus ferus]|nr:hypothetical protein CB1_000154006 [Camelus ferus]
MDKSLLRGLPILLCCFRGGLQWPYIRVNRRENCSYVFFLFASTARELYVEEDRIPNDGTPWLTFRGCLENCANVDNIKWSIYLVNFRFSALAPERVKYLECKISMSCRLLQSLVLSLGTQVASGKEEEDGPLIFSAP